MPKLLKRHKEALFYILLSTFIQSDESPVNKFIHFPFLSFVSPYISSVCMQLVISGS